MRTVHRPIHLMKPLFVLVILTILAPAALCPQTRSLGS